MVKVFITDSFGSMVPDLEKNKIYEICTKDCSSLGNLMKNLAKKKNSTERIFSTIKTFLLKRN